jgi:hypothetical protein
MKHLQSLAGGGMRPLVRAPWVGEEWHRNAPTRVGDLRDASVYFRVPPSALLNSFFQMRDALSCKPPYSHLDAALLWPRMPGLVYPPDAVNRPWPHNHGQSEWHPIQLMFQSANQPLLCPSRAALVGRSCG